jgi:hypothetical protein
VSNKATPPKGKQVFGGIKSGATNPGIAHGKKPQAKANKAGRAQTVGHAGKAR